MNEKQIWRGVEFDVVQVHKGCTEWRSLVTTTPTQKPTWKAVQYCNGDVWFARLRIGCHVLSGEGPNPRLALDVCREQARALMAELRKVLPK